MRGVAREQCKQQAVRSRIGEHDAVGCIAVLANEIEERGEVRRKQQMGLSPRIPLGAARLSAYPFIGRHWAISGHRADLSRCTFGPKQTLVSALQMSASGCKVDMPLLRREYPFSTQNGHCRADLITFEHWRRP